MVGEVVCRALRLSESCWSWCGDGRGQWGLDNKKVWDFLFTLNYIYTYYWTNVETDTLQHMWIIMNNGIKMKYAKFYVKVFASHSNFLLSLHGISSYPVYYRWSLPLMMVDWDTYFSNINFFAWLLVRSDLYYRWGRTHHRNRGDSSIIFLCPCY